MDKISIGIKGFDEIMGGLYPGDNIVWQVEDIKDYKYVVNAFVKQSIKDGKIVEEVILPTGQESQTAELALLRKKLTILNMLEESENNTLISSNKGGKK